MANLKGARGVKDQPNYIEAPEEAERLTLEYMEENKFTEVNEIGKDLRG